MESGGQMEANIVTQASWFLTGLPFLVFTAVIVMFFIAWQKGSGFIIKHLRSELDRKDVLLKRQDQVYLRRTGYLECYGDYDLLSLDNGLTWYEITEDEDGSVNLALFCNQEIIAKIMASENKASRKIMLGLDEAAQALKSSFEELGIMTKKDK